MSALRVMYAEHAEQLREAAEKMRREGQVCLPMQMERQARGLQEIADAPDPNALLEEYVREELAASWDAGGQHRKPRAVCGARASSAADTPEQVAPLATHRRNQPLRLMELDLSACVQHGVGTRSTCRFTAGIPSSLICHSMRSWAVTTLMPFWRA